MFLAVAVAVFVIVLAAYLSLLESSVLGIDEIKLATILRKQPDHKEHLKKIFKYKREHLSSLVLLNTLVSIAGSSFIGALSVQVFDHLVMVVFTTVLTYLMVVFAKILPKVLAVQVSEQVVISRAPLIRFIREAVKPVLWLALFWLRFVPSMRAEKASRDDLHSIIRHYNKRGIIGRGERRLAEMALISEQQTLADLLTDIEKSTYLKMTSAVGSLESILRSSPQKRYVVMNGDVPVGVVLYRHLARCFVKGQSEKQVGDLMRETIRLTPEHTLAEAVSQFREAGASVALLDDRISDEVKFVTAKQVYQALLRAS